MECVEGPSVDGPSVFPVKKRSPGAGRGFRTPRPELTRRGGARVLTGALRERFQPFARAFGGCPGIFTPAILLRLCGAVFTPGWGVVLRYFTKSLQDAGSC